MFLFKVIIEFHYFSSCLQPSQEFAIDYKVLKTGGTKKPETRVSPSPNLYPAINKAYRNDDCVRTQKQQGKNPDNG